jgi:uncharacterized protein (DUF885 family)
MKMTSLTAIVLCALAGSILAADANKQVWNFEDTAVGKLPAGFKGEVGKWAVARDGDNQVVAQSAKNDNRVFNVLLAAKTHASDIDLSVKLKALAGELDRGGGLVWRARDKDNYYVARQNPLEDNFRLYKVEKGKRTMFKTADVKAAPGWHTLRVTMKGCHIECYFDGKKYLVADDSTFPDAGMIGLWSKADAQSYFDDLTMITDANTIDANDENTTFDALAKQFIDEFPALHPVSATQLGDHRFDGEVDDVSDEQRQEEVAFCRKYIERLSQIPRDKLTRDRQVDAELLRQQLQATIWQLDTLQEWSWNPLQYTALVGDAVYGLMAREFAPTAERLLHVAQRLEQFPRVLSQVRTTLEPPRVPKIHAETAVKQNRGVLSIVEQEVEPLANQLDEANQTRLKKAIDTARQAIEEHQQWLEKELLPAAAGDARIGHELFDQKLAFTLQSRLTRDDIRGRAGEELRRVREQMWNIAREVYRQRNPFTKFPDAPSDEYKQAIIRAALEVAYADRPARDHIVETAREALARCTEFVREKDLVTVPDDPVEIIVMPEFRRGVSLAYCDSPGPLDVGQKTFYAVAPLPEDWTDAQVTSFLREYNLRSIYDLTVHEAMPGHFLQLAVANRYPSTLRAVLSSGVFIEGWAVYTEQLMAEQGLLDHDPLMRLIALKWYLRSIANAFIDQAIHCDGMQRDEAMRLMIEDTFQEEREAAAKWIRAQLTSTQLSTYFVGYQEHRDLREEAERDWGEEFTLKEYHDRLLAFGSPPVQYARALLLSLPIPSSE